MKIKIGGKKYKKTSQTIIPNDNRRLVHRIEVCDKKGNSKTFLGSANSSSDKDTPLLIQVLEAEKEAEKKFQVWKEPIEAKYNLP